MPRGNLPTIRNLARELADISRNVEATDDPDDGGCDVRLCVWPTGTWGRYEWCVRSGDVSYDQSHAPFCGAASVPGVVNGRVVRFRSRDVARDLLEQVREQIAMTEAL